MKCIIFDMDGTLIDSETKYYLIWKKLLDDAGFALSKDFYKTILGCPTAQIKPLFTNHYGPSFPFDNFFDQFMKIRETYVLEGAFQLTNGTAEFLEKCVDHQITCGVATSSIEKEAIMILKKMNILHYFSFTVFGNEIEKGKPDPAIFELAIEKSGCQKKDIIAFEDSKNGILSAHSAGLKVYHINQFIDLDEHLDAVIEKKYSNFSEAVELLATSLQ